MTKLHRVTASQVAALTVSVPAGAITASTTSRTLGGPVVQYGVYGRTSAGRLKVRAGALRFPDDLTRVKLTREHDRAWSRGYLTSVHQVGDVVRVAARVSDGPDGDAALLEAADHTRDGFSFDVVDATIEGDEITDALVIAIGQVGIPAYDDMRIDTIAASADPAPPTGDLAAPASPGQVAPTPTDPTGPTSGPRDTEGTNMTPDQVARLAELRARNESELSDAERTELALLVQLEAATNGGTAAASDPAPSVSASAAVIPAVPTGVPSPARTAPRGSALQAFYDLVVGAYRPGGGGAAAITAALSDVTHSGAGANIEAPAWSGELWSGLEYEPQFTPLLSSGDLTSYEGHGWRFVTKPEMQDYAGDKAAIPSGPVTTEPSTYEAARMAVGHDIDRKFYDFPNAGFLQAYAEAVRESWAIKLDAKVESYISSNAVPVTTADGGDVDTDPDVVVESTLLKAVARGALALKRAKVGRPTFVVVNDDDWFSLFDVTEDSKPAFLSLFGIDPSNWTSSDQVESGQVLVGVRQAATVRTLPGSPIRVDAQHVANGGIDSAFFGYWAVETHHESGIVSVGYDPAA